MRARTLSALAFVALFCNFAHAESFFQIEAGLGASHIVDLGDGTWYQQALPYTKHENVPAAMIGFTGELLRRDDWSVRYHADYVYIGEYSASCECVPDANYDPVRHLTKNLQNVPRLSPFNGHGHVQGLALTLDVGYEYRGFRFAAEGGMWGYNQSWTDSLYTLDNKWVTFHRSPHIQFGYVAGARIEKGPVSLSYRYYQVRADWSTGVPGLAGGAHVVMLNYRF